ncbi:hypothetical protein JTE90_001144 [Oedothorax gibbosus]|uniref:Tetratricopeptide repeat protein 33 n=1 Tax=Oedothorax gibbosus TaxID=931172 RepID=A0AAV6VJ21_9ARAC|nr:hypothetical protein JTE90_001144 [Oedothorax gibbosus]
MTTFSWKRKAGQNVSRDISCKFEANAQPETLANEAFLQQFKRKRKGEEENRKKKCEELKGEGVRLAQLNRFHEAVAEFDKALLLIPDEKILEMRAQALLELDIPFPAVQSAEKATKLNPRFWEAYQTLGRSQLGIGDLQMAKSSFSKAIHVNPIEKELWDDLKWTIKLKHDKEELVSETTNTEQGPKPYTI